MSYFLTCFPKIFDGFAEFAASFACSFFGFAFRALAGLQRRRSLRDQALRIF